MTTQSIAPTAPSYPRALSLLPSAQGWTSPPTLYYRGTFLPDRPGVAIVGSRTCSDEGAAFAHALAGAIASKGWTIYSGGAAGIDAAAHRGALDADGHTVAVVTASVYKHYPEENVELLEQIVKQAGALLSIWPPETLRQTGMFPRRNWITAALSRATIAVEVGRGRTGSLAMSRAVRKLGRPLLVPPQSPWSSAQGCNDLIGDGAIAITSVEDAIAKLTPFMEGTDQLAPRVPPPALSADATNILHALDDGPIHSDALCIITDLPPQRVSQALLSLRLNRLVTTAPSGAIKRC